MSTRSPYEAPDASLYDPRLGLWTDPHPGEATPLLWYAKVVSDHFGLAPSDVRYWAEPRGGAS